MGIFLSNDQYSDIVTITGPYVALPAGVTTPFKVDASGYALTGQERADLFSAGAIQISQPGGAVFLSPTIARAPGEMFEPNDGANGHHRTRPDLAVLTDGSFVITWTTNWQEADTNGITAQRYDATGAKLGGEIIVNTHGPGSQDDQSITALAGGGYVIAWNSGGQDGSANGVYLQQFAADGTRIGAEQRVNTTTAGAQFAPSIAALSGGGYVVAWTATPRDIHAQLYDASGARVGGEFVINATTPLDQTESAVAALGDGFIVTWTSQREGAGQDILSQRFDAAGGRIGAETVVNTWPQLNESSSSVTVLGGGRYVVAWLTTSTNGQSHNINSQLFDASGAPIGDQAQVSTTFGGKGGVEVGRLADGGYMIVWHVDIQTAPPGGGPLPFGEVIGRRYDANGVAVGGEVRLNPVVEGYQQGGTFGQLADGSIVVAWYGPGPHAAFNVQAAIHAPITFQTLTPGADALIASTGGRLVTTTTADLTSIDSLVGGSGLDRLDLTSGGVLDLTAPAQFSSVEIIAGSAESDRIIVSSTRLADVSYISGGAGTDRLELVGGGVFDLHAAALVSIEALTGSAAADEVILGAIPVGMSLEGGDGVDILQVSAGQVYLSQWTITGFETIRGTDGGYNANNVIYMNAPPPGLLLVDGGAVQAHNSLSFAGATAGVNMTFTTVRIYRVEGSAYADVLRADDSGVTFQAGDGDDVVFGGAGEDLISGGAGNNTLYGGGGRDTISIHGQLAHEISTAYGGDGNDTITGGLYTDRLYGDAGQDHIEGWSGNDLIDGGDALDFLLGNEGDDQIFGGGGDDQLRGDSGNDHLDGGANVDRVWGGLGDDVAIGGDGDDWLYGEGGSDQLYGGEGIDWLEDGGESVNRDFLFGGSGSDVYIVTSSLTGPTDLIFEGGDNPDLAAGPGDVDYIYSRGEFFWDYYGVGEKLYIQRIGGSQLVGGTTNQEFFGSSASDQIIAYGGSNRVDAGEGTDAISFGLYGLDESLDGVNTLVMHRGSGLDYVFEFESGVDKIDLTAFNFGITGAQVLAQAVNVDQAGTANDYCYFYLTSAHGVDNYVAFIGLLSHQLQAADFIT